MTLQQSQHHYGDGYRNSDRPHTHAILWPPVMRVLSALPRGSHILDAGSGNGAFADELNSAGFDVVGIELEESGVNVSRKHFPEIRFELASVYDDISALFGVKFDAVVALEVVEHLYDPRKFAKRVYECLRPGGIFILSTPYHGYLKNVAIAATGGFDRHANPLWDGGHIKFWSRRTLTSLLNEGGFQVREFIGVGRVPYLWKGMILVCSRGE